MKESIKHWKQTPNLKKLHTFIPYFVYILKIFYSNFIDRNFCEFHFLSVANITGDVLKCFSCNPGISIVLHWPTPDVHIFDTDPSQLKITTNYIMDNIYYSSNLQFYLIALNVKDFNILIVFIQLLSNLIYCFAGTISSP